MSLFKFCPWWTTQCPDLGANYDACSLHCCRLGLVDNEKDYLVIGSHTGYLSIFNPTERPDIESSMPVFSAANDADEEGLFAASLNAASPATDLDFEIKMAQPIIGITSGRFIAYID